MFDELKRELRRLHGRHEVQVSVPSDTDGYLDRECPAPECLFRFKVHGDDWRDKVRDEEVFCSFCGHTATSDTWWTPEQIKHAEAVVSAQLEARLGNAMRRDAQRWNSRQSRNGLLRVTMSVRNTPLHALPTAAADPMRLRITCPSCACRYAVVGAAFFCPACGHNAADIMFQQSLAGIRAALDSLPRVRAAIPDVDAAETTVRLVIESSLQNAVTAFQRYAEALYALWPAQSKPRRNAFQNLAEGSSLWKTAAGKGFDVYLTPTAMAELARLFQQRHLLAHTQGLVDQDYLARSGDRGYLLGQRIVIRDSAVAAALVHVEALAAGMAADAP